jgi:hypothetical protein
MSEDIYLYPNFVSQQPNFDLLMLFCLRFIEASVRFKIKRSVDAKEVEQVPHHGCLLSGIQAHGPRCVLL